MTHLAYSLRRFALVSASLLGLAASASAYYHFIHFAGRTGPFVRIPEKFDLSSLPNNTVSFYVSSQPPDKLATDDNLTAVLSQIRLAGLTWNGVPTAQISVAWGGLFDASSPQTTPHIEVIFGEVPPGLIALGGPTSRGDLVKPDGKNAFVPITRSVVVLSKDLSSRPSYSTGFYLTAVHEIGHALGLQHTAASSVMSTEATRATTKAGPLGADDIAGISVLYPGPGLLSQFGSISGQVTMDGSGVHLASVVAITPSGDAISTLTNPDGTYEIDGLRPASYCVYVHALPPSVQSDLGPSEVVLPIDRDGQAFSAGDAFTTQFYPGTKDPAQATLLTVKAGTNLDKVDFSVQKHAAPDLFGVSTYSFPGNVAVKPAFVNFSKTSRPLIVASGDGLTDGTQVSPGLNVAVIGGGVNLDGLLAYPADASFLQINLMLTPFTALGPRHLVFSTPDELFVLPSGLNIVDRQPPSLTGAASTTDDKGNRFVTLSGADLYPDTRVLFDGERGTVAGAASDHTSLTVVPPPAPMNYASKIIALNSDRQSSLFLAPPVTYSYDFGPAGASAISLPATSQPPGTEAMIEINAQNLTFVDGRTSVGFGSSDVVAKDVWAVSPTLVRANVYVAPQAHEGDVLVTVTSGLESATLPAGFHIRPAVANQPGLGSGILNTDATQSTVYPGSSATIPVYGLPADTDASSVTLRLNDTPVPVTALAAGRLTFQVPETAVAGRAVVRLETGAGAAPPVFVTIAEAPPIILAATAASAAIDSTHPAHPGDTVIFAVKNLGEPGATVANERIRLAISGLDHAITGPVTAATDNPKIHFVKTVIGTLVNAADKVPVSISIEGRPSLPFTIPVVGK